MVVSRRSFMIGTGAAVAGATLLPSMSFASVPKGSWFDDAVLYELYPQSFLDSDGNGIGDLRGATERLDYLQWLGVTTIWMNPIFPSPFTDAGYDIANYTAVHPRYGTEADVVRFAEEARLRGIRVLFDLVVGHTSDQHPWFQNSLRDFDDSRYIWATPDQLPKDGSLPDEFVASPGPRPGAFRKNYYATQPAINYGYARMNPNEPWRQPVDADGPQQNRQAVRDIMDFWLQRGISGFRCDMAATLVKDDPGWVETGKLWSEMRAWLDRNHPDAVLISEWGDPATSIPAGFSGDFFLPVNGPGDGAAWKSLWQDNPYFSAEGKGTAKIFVDAWKQATQAIGDRDGHTLLISANHDGATRLNNGVRKPEEIPAAFVFLLTWPSIPSLYYGEEIGMRMVEGLPDVEGSAGRQRNRTPMQWDDSANAGFSSAPADRLYIPIDPDPNRPTVKKQLADGGSLLHLVRNVLRLRREHPELGTSGDVRVLGDGYPLTYLRGDRFLVTVNPSRNEVTIGVDDDRLAGAKPVVDSGIRRGEKELTVPAFGYGIFEL